MIKKLKKYENPHTPSSKQGFDKPQAQGLPVGRKPGKNYNHKRTTRPKDTPNTPPITVTADVNPSNGNPMANLLHFEYRVTLDGIADIFTNAYDISMSAPTVQELCNRAVEKATPTYEGIHAKLEKSKIANADETGSNQNEKSEWLWGFFTKSIAFFVFFKQRGGNVIDNVLGKNFKSILGCDGWLTYKVFSGK